MKSFRRSLRVLLSFLVVSYGVTICEAQTPPTRILPLGDSLTSGTTVEGAYRNRLYNLLTTAGYNVDFVGTQTDANNPALPDRNHQGMSGYRIDQLQTGLGSWLNAIEDPDVVLLMIGTNDFSANFNIASAPTRLAALVADIATKRPFAKIILSNLPLRTDDPNMEAQQVAFNASIPGIVSAQVALGRQVTFVDIHAALVPGDLTEGVHPNLAGYNKMADVWFPAVTSVITPLGSSNPPAIVRTEPPVDLQHIAVRFSKPLADSATALANFSLSGGLTISQAVLDSTKRTITLTTSSQSPATLYTLSVSGVRDRTPQQNLIAPGSTVAYSSFTLGNGSFEAGETGWTMTGNRIIYPSDGTYVASHGVNMAIFNAGNSTPNAVVSQTFTTVPGQFYKLEFDVGILAINFAGQILGVEVAGTSPLVSVPIEVLGNGLGNSVWTPKSYTFTANSATTTLTFRDQSASSDGVDLMLDQVRVSATPLPVNTAPVAVADSYSTVQSTALVVPAAGVLTNDTDAQSNPLTAVFNVGPAHGILSLNANGGFTYTPTAGYTGPDSFTYRANDGSLNSNVATVSIAVNPPSLFVNGSFEAVETGWTMTGNRVVYQNDGTYVAFDGTKMAIFNAGNSTPDAVVSQAFTTTPGQTYQLSFQVGILANNGAEQKLQVAVTGTSPLLSQTESLFGNSQANTVWNARSYSFTANSATTTLTFSDISPSTTGADLLLDNVSISPVLTNQAPVAVADSYFTGFNTALVIPAAGVLANDTDAESNPLNAIINSEPAHGTLTLNSNGGFTYTPATGYSGPDSFTYRANDGSLNSNLATVSITVVPPGSLVNGSFESGETGWTMTGNRVVYQNDGTYVAFDGTKMAIFNAGNSAPNAVVSQTFATTPGQAYTLDFNMGIVALNGAEQKLQISVTGVTTPFSLTESLFGNSLGNSVWSAKSYSFTASGTSATLIFTDISTSTTLVDLMLDNVRIAPASPPANTAPVAVADSYSTNQNVALVVPAAGVLLNDTDAQSNPLTAVLGTGPSHGTLNLNANGGFTYTPTTGYSGPDSFTYRANDGLLNSNLATVSLTVNVVNTAPVAVANSYSTNQGVALVVSASGVLANDTDAQSNPLTAVLGTGPSHGTLNLNANGGFTYTPAAGHSGADSFTYRANDGLLNSNLATVSITVNLVNTAPVGVADSYVINQGVALVVPAAGVLANDTDAQSNPLTAVLVANPSHGTLTLNVNGGFTYTPLSSYSGADSFTYRANDGTLNSNVATVSITINAVNAAPVAAADSYSTNVSTALVIAAPGVLANDTDAQANPLTASLGSGPSHGSVTLNANGSFTYTPVTDYTGADSFTYRANDGLMNSNIATVNLTINPASAQVLVNGSFESGFNAWTSSGNLTIESASPYPPTDGNKLLACNSRNLAPNGILSQTFATVSGKTYTLTFDMGVLAYVKKQQKLTVTVTGTGTDKLLSQTINLKGEGNGSSIWSSKSYTFVANSASTVLSFQDRSSFTEGLDLLLDKVRVVGPPAVVNAAPVAVADAYSVNKNTSLVVPAAGVLTNDTDPQSNPLTSVLDVGPVNGTLSLNVNGSFTYAPAIGYTGVDSFTYHANDGSLNSGIVKVTITVNEVVTGILANGSFESDFNGWTASGNRSIGYYPATDGIKIVSFNGDNKTPDGVLAQTFGTIPGQTYSITFDASVLAYTTDSQILQVSVTGSGNLLTQTVTIVGQASGLGPWLAQNYTFMANSATTTLTFRDQSTATIGIDLLLDHVRVVPIAAPVAAAALQLSAVPGGKPRLDATPSLTSTPDTFIIRMTAPEDGIYVLERSEDLQTWEPVDTMGCEEQHLIEFYDTRDALGSEAPKKRLFYRIGLQPGN
ncbi:MAG: Ig-like domain-containing protein [Verrucomicrobiota bacterium]